MADELQTLPAPTSVFADIKTFETAQRMANLLMTSDIVPDTYKSKLGNCLIALEIAQRSGFSIMAVMQNLHVIKGRPSWSSAFIISAINSCGRFNELEFEMTDLGEIEAEYDEVSWEGPQGHKVKKTLKKKVRIHNYECYAHTTSKKTGNKLKGTTVSIKMAVAEGWYGKDGSKWQTMPELMLQYRGAAFFGRVYAPELTMGMQVAEEIEDYVGPENAKDITPKKTATAEELTKEFLTPEPAREPAAETTENAKKSPISTPLVQAPETPPRKPAFRRSSDDDYKEYEKEKISQ